MKSDNESDDSEQMEDSSSNPKKSPKTHGNPANHCSGRTSQRMATMATKGLISNCLRKRSRTFKWMEDVTIPRVKGLSMYGFIKIAWATKHW